MAEALKTETRLRQTPLHSLHVELGARMVPFGGYEMPVQYRGGIISEHAHTRNAAGLFDVSHMGQVELTSDKDPALALERLVPGEIVGLEHGCMRYTLLLNETGGILDDLMVTRISPEHLFLVVNAGRKEADFEHLELHLGAGVKIKRRDDRALLALQGAQAASVLARLCPLATELTFLTGAEVEIAGVNAFITRSGYTGEDGFEISIAAAEAEVLARMLLAEPEVAPVGLGARDSLRLEAGLCLYGHDIDETTTPIEAGLAWTVNKRRREEGGFPGAEVIMRQLSDGVGRRRVGIRLQGRTPVREGAPILVPNGPEVGRITSGGFGPTLGGPVAMGYVAPTHAEVNTHVEVMVRGKALSARVAALPFIKPNYHRN